MKKYLNTEAANNIRILSAAMVEKAKSGHPGGAMGGADFINILYTEFLNFDPDDMAWPERDRFFLDPGHMSPMLYSVLMLCRKFSMNELKNFRQWGSATPGHPELNVARGIENTSGPLGQGHTMAVGAAIAERFLAAHFGEWLSHKTYTFISDGGVQEEISQGAGRLAGYLGLSNLIMFYDSNDIQLSTETRSVTREDTAKKYESWGWKVRTINGNDSGEIRAVLSEAVEEKEKPFLIIGKTTMGKGCVAEDGSSFENRVSTHGMPLSKAGASFEKTVKNLGGNSKDSFAIFPEVQKYYEQVLMEKKSYAAKKRKLKKTWEREHQGLAEKYNGFLRGKISVINYHAIEQKANVASRAASSVVLSHFAKHIENMVVASADLSNSDKTDGFLRNSKAFGRNDFSGAFLQMGVSELTMAAIMNGMALHGGIIPAGGTFFVFSDYMKPAVRMAALMELPVKYIWTHDAFRVGEDGPTHQPVEQEAQIRLMENLRNRSGKRSMLVLRPADAAETTVAWKMAMENKHTPTALILSRQGIQDIQPMRKSRYEEALQAEKGAYIVKDSKDKSDIILLASGSEVSTLMESAGLLEKNNNIKVRVVSVISEGLFREQPETYQENILPSDTPTLGLTAGLPITLAGLVGPQGIVFGLESFGFSAPYKVLDEKLGFTGESIYRKVLKYLGI